MPADERDPRLLDHAAGTLRIAADRAAAIAERIRALAEASPRDRKAGEAAQATTLLRHDLAELGAILELAVAAERGTIDETAPEPVLAALDRQLARLDEVTVELARLLRALQPGPARPTVTTSTAAVRA